MGVTAFRGTDVFHMPSSTGSGTGLALLGTVHATILAFLCSVSGSSFDSAANKPWPDLKELFLILCVYGCGCGMCIQVQAPLDVFLERDL